MGAIGRELGIKEVLVWQRQLDEGEGGGCTIGAGEEWRMARRVEIKGVLV